MAAVANAQQIPLDFSKLKIYIVAEDAIKERGSPVAEDSTQDRIRQIAGIALASLGALLILTSAGLAIACSVGALPPLLLVKVDLIFSVGMMALLAGVHLYQNKPKAETSVMFNQGPFAVKL